VPHPDTPGIETLLRGLLQEILSAVPGETAPATNGGAASAKGSLIGKPGARRPVSKEQPETESKLGAGAKELVPNAVQMGPVQDTSMAQIKCLPVSVVVPMPPAAPPDPIALPGIDSNPTAPSPALSPVARDLTSADLLPTELEGIPGPAEPGMSNSMTGQPNGQVPVAAGETTPAERGTATEKGGQSPLVKPAVWAPEAALTNGSTVAAADTASPRQTATPAGAWNKSADAEALAAPIPTPQERGTTARRDGQDDAPFSQREEAPIQSAPPVDQTPAAEPLAPGVPVASTTAETAAKDSPRDQATPTRTSAGLSRKSSASVVAQVLALSGQVPQTVDSITAATPAPHPAQAPLDAGRAPQPQAPGSSAAPDADPRALPEPSAPATETQVRVLAVDTPDREEVAFGLKMKALQTPGAVRQASPAGLGTTEGAQRTPSAAQQGTAAPPDPLAAEEKRISISREPDPGPGHSWRERRPDAEASERNSPLAAANPGRETPPVSPNPQVRTESTPERAAATEAKPVRPQELMDSAAAKEPAKTAFVRDMKFEVAGGEQRVEVRLTERSGEVRMTVRTADEPLGNALRENLPALSARLAENGFKSDVWHPAASSTNELRHAADSTARDPSQDPNAQPRQQDRQSQGEAGQRHPKGHQETTPQKEKGKDFAWLMSSLRS
jgi:hypothetical protein